MPSAIRIRSATQDDAPALGRLGALLVAQHHSFDPDRFIAATPDTARGYGGFLRGELARTDAVVLVAEAAGEVVGYTYAALEGTDFMALRGPAGVVYDLLVAPERRCEGIGRQLLGAVMTRLVERGAPRVVLFTAEHNTGAQRMFAGMGFRRTMVEMTWEAPPIG